MDTCINKGRAFEGLRLNKNALYWRDAASVTLAAAAASLSDTDQCECVYVCVCFFPAGTLSIFTQGDHTQVQSPQTSKSVLINLLCLRLHYY